MYLSLLFWLALFLPGYVVVRRFWDDELESGLLGTVSLSYLATFGLLSPVSILCYMVGAPLWVFSGACFIAVVAAVVELTRRGWWRVTGKLMVGGLCVELVILLADMVFGARVGALTGGDAVVHLTRIRVLLDHGFNNNDPFVAVSYFFPIYHTNLLHALYAACSEVTGIHHLPVWFASLPWAKLLIASGSYYMVWCVFQRRWVAWVAAVFTVGFWGPVTFVVYPNKLAPLWLLAMMIGFAVRACSSPCTWREPLRLGIGSLVLGQMHSLYGAFAGVALGPVLGAFGLVRIWRRRPDRWRLAVCTVSLTAALPFLLVSKLNVRPLSPPASAAQVTPSEDGESPASDTEWTTIKLRRGWGTLDWRSACLVFGVVCALAGSRRKQAAVLLAVAGTVCLIFYVPPLCTAAVGIFEKKWIVGRMGLVLHLAYIGLVPASVAFLIAWALAKSWGKPAAVAVAVVGAAALIFFVPPVCTNALQVLGKDWALGRLAFAIGLISVSVLLLVLPKTRSWWVRSICSVLILLVAASFPKLKDPPRWQRYWTTAAAPRAAREGYLTMTHQVLAFCRTHIPRGATVLLESQQGMVLTMVHDCHIVAPRRGGNGIFDWDERRADLKVMLAAETPWEKRRTLLRKYDVELYFPAGSPVAWTQGHVKELRKEPGFHLFVLDTGR